MPDHQHFEVEKKFTPTREQVISLLNGASLQSTEDLVDTYFDTKLFTLTTRDWWLRQRNGQWELKIPNILLAHHERSVDRYQEIQDQEKIAELLGCDPKKELPEQLDELGIKSFCTAHSHREKYLKGEFTIDVDFVHFDDFTYQIVEIELMVGSEEQMAEAAEKILLFAQKEGLCAEYVRGKIIEYLFRKRPQHFQALIAAGIVPPPDKKNPVRT